MLFLVPMLLLPFASAAPIDTYDTCSNNVMLCIKYHDMYNAWAKTADNAQFADCESKWQYFAATVPTSFKCDTRTMWLVRMLKTTDGFFNNDIIYVLCDDILNLNLDVSRNNDDWVNDAWHENENYVPFNYY